MIERAVIMSEAGKLSVDVRWLAAAPRAVSSPASPSLTLLAHQKAVIEGVLAETKGRVSGPFGAATKLGIPSSTLESKIKALEIDKHQFKTALFSDDDVRSSRLKQSA